ncbi:type IV pilin protein [Pseudoduganella violaceinigra]|uniref:type IV pilin protein n=1 Tax=Pseudoduganella violaceinigra TaxID=246602 RepID=UPI0004854518|nr:type IV pilin protein [Pseudoduganella violaceinigra]
MNQQKAVTARQSGVTLIELMVTLAIIAILTAIAVPQYSDYSKRGKIPQATNTLATMRVKLEQYYQDNRTYIGACANNTVAPLPPADDFTYACPTLTATTFTVTATGTGGMTDFNYSIDESNAKKTTKLPTGWGPTSGTMPITCWVRKKGGAC